MRGRRIRVDEVVAGKKRSGEAPPRRRRPLQHSRLVRRKEIDMEAEPQEEVGPLEPDGERTDVEDLELDDDFTTWDDGD
jgi:hypothetical protein